ncbi:MAG: hypothetical protein EOP07_01500 [Proteobacteria bacterium]|nr:MAG: hypothetical protein EOP07_01500 [Pseudomonadota bacterium]
MQRITLVWLLLGLMVTSCFKTPMASQGSVKRLSKDKASGVATEVSSTKSITAVDFQSKENVVLAVNGEKGSIAGTSISIAPGSLSISTSIIIEQGADLQDTSMTQEVSLSNNTAITQAGSGIIVRPSTATVLQKPITLNLPLPVNLGLHLAGDYYAVYYKYLDPISNQLLTGYRIVDGVDVKLVYDENVKADMIQFEGYFGAYWIVKLSRDIPKEEVPAPKVSIEPIANKANAQVFAASGGIVAETQVVAVQAKVEVVWKKPSLQFIAGSRKAVLAVDMSSVSVFKSCKADVFEAVTSLSGRTLDTGKDTNITFPLNNLLAHKLVARFRCLDSESRVSISPWSDSLAVEAYKAVTVTHVKTSLVNGLYSVNAAIPITISFTGSVTVQGVPTLTLETGSIDRNALYKSGSGTDKLIFEYVVQQGDETAVLNYISTSALTALSASMTDVIGVAVITRLPELTTENSLAGQSTLVVDSVAPFAPSSVGFSGTTSSSATFPGTWTAMNDSNFKQYNAKICTASDCVTGCQSAVSSVNNSASFTAAGSNGPFYACVQSEDLAGNLSAFVPSTNSLTVITSGPVVTSVVSQIPPGNVGLSQVINIDVNFSSPVVVTGTGIELLLDLNTSGRAASYVSGSGTSSLRFTYTTQIGDNTSDLNYKSITALTLGSGTIKSSGGVNAVLTLPILTSSQALAGTSAVVIDTIAPATPSLLSPSAAYLTSDLTTVSGTSEANAIITVKSAGSIVGTGTAIGTNWSVNLSSPLGNGDHNLVAFATDAAGNSSANSAVFNTTVRTTGPNIPSIFTLTSPTLNTTPSISGTSEPFLSVKVFANGTQIGTTTASSTGLWTLNSSALSDGTYSITSKAIDPGARESALSSAVSLNVDTSNPTLPTAVTFPIGSISNAPSVQVVWTNSADSNFKQHNLKLCTSSNCATGCTAVSVSAVSPASLLGADASSYYACVQGEDLLGHTSAWVASSSTVQIDSTNATITDVTSTLANGYYSQSSVVTIVVTFSKTITITNPSMLKLRLETGTTDRDAIYLSSTLNTITLGYTVQSGDSSPDLNYQSTAALVLNGATIKDNASNDAVLTLPALGSGNSIGGQKAIVIDTTSPTAPATPGFGSAVSNVLSVPFAFANGTDTNFNTHNVKLCPTNDCAASCLAAQTSVSSPATLTGVNGSVFYGCVQSVDRANLTSGWIPSVATMTFDTTPPTVGAVSSTKANGSYTVGTNIPLTVSFSEPVFVIGAGDIKLLIETGATDRNVSYTSGSGTSVLTFTYTVTAPDTSADLDYQSASALTVGTGSIKDAAGNNAVLTLQAPGSVNSLGLSKAIVIDTTSPAAPTIVSPGSGSYVMTHVTTISGISETGASITVKNAGSTIVTGTASGTNWSLTLATPLNDGSYNLTAFAMDAAGNTSMSSVTNAVTVDTSAPIACTLNVGPATTSNPTPTINGNCEPNMTVNIYDSSTLVATGTSDSSGNFSMSTAVLNDGTHSIKATATDPGSRTSAASNIYTVTVNTAAPMISNVADLSPMHTNTVTTVPASATGASTYAWTKISGTGTLTFGSPTAAQTTVSASAEGSYVARLTATSSGGISAFQDITIVWDTTPPVFEGISDVRRSADNTTAWIYWKAGSDTVTNAPDLTYELCWGVSVCATNFTAQATVDGSRFDYQVSALNAGSTYNFGIRAKDKAGNTTAIISGRTNASMGTATSVATGTFHSCAITGGVIKCWGLNGSGQLGDGGNVDSAQPVTVSGLSGLTPTKVVVGGYFSCGLFSNNTVRCWGRNDFGQLGTGDTTGLTSGTTEALNLTTVVDIEAGSHHACAKTLSNQVYCWGYNAFGQVGNGSTTNRPSPTLISNLSDISDIGLGSNHSCAVNSTGSTFCWGLNTGSQLGDGSTSNRFAPVEITSAAGSVQIDGGDDFTCSRLNSGTMMCWGKNGFGQLGRGNNTDASTAAAVVNLTGVTDFSTGAGQVCAKTSSTTYCWGNNEWGQLGNDALNGLNTPNDIPSLSAATTIAMGDTYGCALFSGIAKCWGSNSRGQLGVGAADLRLFPVQVQGVAGTNSAGTKIATGLGHTCSISGTSLYCWGNNNYGQLGNSTTISSLTPVMAQINGTAVSVVAGDSFTCALLDDGSVKCWGLGTAGQLGDNLAANSALPRSVGITASKITASGDSACALLTTQKIVCWGKNADGNLGDGTKTNREAPTTPSETASTNFIDIANGPRSTCAVLADNSMKCWGANDAGQLGDLTTTNRLIPTLSSIISSVSQVAVGITSSCALLLDQTVKCWGNNALGQLGNGNTNASPTMAQNLAGGLTGVTSIIGSRASFCLMASGGVKCWGSNEGGNLGFGNMENQSTPSPIKGIGAIANLSVGPISTCFTHKAGRVSCIGKGYYGAFGQATPYYWSPSVKVSN